MQFIAAITAVANAFLALVTLGYKVAQLWRESQLKGWVKDGRNLAQALDGATTEEARRELAKAIFSHRAS